MKIGIIGPSKLKEGSEEVIKKLSKIVSEYEVVLTPDSGSVSEFFAKEYLLNNGKKVYSVIPLDDREFGYEWVNQEIGENVNCGIWRNQPEKLNEETDVLICVGYSAGVLAEIAYTKWFKPKPVFIVEELVSGKLPEEIKLDLRYVSVEDLEEELKGLNS